MVTRSVSRLSQPLKCAMVLLLLASSPPAFSQNEASRDPLEPFVGEWLVDNAGPQGKKFLFRKDGARLIGTSPSAEETLNFKATGDFGFLDGTVVDDKGKIPATIELSRRGDRLILELAPQQSEFITITARKAKGQPSAVNTNAAEKAEARVEIAKQKLKEAIAGDDDAALQKATIELQEARQALAELPKSDRVEKAASVPPVSESKERTTSEVGTVEAAIKKVSDLPTVREWMKAVEAANKTGDQARAARFEAHEEAKRFVVHVYEYVGTEEEGHTATLGWYNVDKSNGEVTEEKMF